MFRKITIWLFLKEEIKVRFQIRISNAYNLTIIIFRNATFYFWITQNFTKNNLIVNSANLI